jgi:predicted GNAT family N-acyltransferase
LRTTDHGADPGDPVPELRIGDWATLRNAASAVRVAVFVDEQGFPLAEEWDDADAVSLHVVARIGGVPVGTGRLLPDDRIGPMAVLAAWRGAGVGGRILERLVDEARARGAAQVTLSSQLSACGFYLRHGFDAQGEVFEDTGVPHRTMRRALR